MRQKIALIFLLSFLPSCFITAAETNRKKRSGGVHEMFMSMARSTDRREFNASDDFHEARVDPRKWMKERDMIERLPGQPEVDFKQYGGYVTVSRGSGRAFYYYFVEARHSPTSLPLLLWLNGGPGCSSIGYGAMEELGPFRVRSDGETLDRNEFSWNQAANVLFVESPAGVGFSYSNTSADFLYGGDRRTASDNYAFLVNWLERFPEYKSRDFYISGESYAGHYAPQLAHTILYHNHKQNRTVINLKGIIIGNPTINDETDARGMYQFYESHALISEQTLARIVGHCDFSDDNRGMSTECMVGILESQRNTGALDIYNIYAPICSNTTSGMKIDPCMDEYVHAYLNRPEVQQALHANVTNIPYDWQGCSKVIGKWQDSPSTVIPLLKEFIAGGLRVWIYSGDMDGRIPVTSTKLSIQLMKLTPTTPWLPWYLDDEVGGYTQVYEGNVTFATVRGAGHQVPTYQPARALSLVHHFLLGENLPTSRNRTLVSSSHF